MGGAKDANIRVMDGTVLEITDRYLKRLLRCLQGFAESLQQDSSNESEIVNGNRLLF